MALPTKTPKSIKETLKYNLRCRQYISIHTSNLHLTHRGQVPYADVFHTIARTLWAPRTLTLPRLLDCVIHPLMEIGVSYFNNVLSANQTHIVDVNKLEFDLSLASTRSRKLHSTGWPPWSTATITQEAIKHTFISADTTPNKAPEQRCIHTDTLNQLVQHTPLGRKWTDHPPAPHPPHRQSATQGRTRITVRKRTKNQQICQDSMEMDPTPPAGVYTRTSQRYNKRLRQTAIAPLSPQLEQQHHSTQPIKKKNTNTS